MSRHEIAALICKTLALILFAVAAVLSITAASLLGFVLLASPFSHLPHGQDLIVFLVAAIPVLTMVGVGAIYWLKSKSLASLMVSADPRPVAFQIFTVQDAMTVTFSAVGLVFFLAGVRDVVRAVFILRLYSAGHSDSGYGFLMSLAVIQLTLAAWLILGSRGIVGAIHWCQTAGVSQPENESKDLDA
ncbi:MAG: hypothetical protein EA424_13890 [Planctomycetaceae bacterium]|nr:MAG: hypothetical protein EA424_13890 [Planctomycetaceae bacterium]